MKRGSRGFSKKKNFPDAVRITNAEGKRVWKLKDKEYPTLRSIFWARAAEEEAKKKSKKVKAKPLTKSE
jgi:hypothetical protein